MVMPVKLISLQSRHMGLRSLDPVLRARASIAGMSEWKN